MDTIVLLQYLSVSSTSGNVTFFVHNRPSLEQFVSGKTRVEEAFNRFRQNGLTLELPENLRIGIASKKMGGGNIVEKNGELFISVTATDEDMERYFMKYAKDY